MLRFLTLALTGALLTFPVSTHAQVMSNDMPMEDRAATSPAQDNQNDQDSQDDGGTSATENAEGDASTQSQDTLPDDQSDVVAGPALRDLEEYTAQLLRGLSEEEAAYIYGIRTRHGVIRSVAVVKEDIGRAVKACGKNNPDLAGPMQNRYEDWRTKVNPVLDQSREQLKQAITGQTIRPVSRLNTLLEKVEAAFEERDAQISKTPVTSEEACTSLLESLDKSEQNLTGLLNQTIDELNQPVPSSDEEENSEDSAEAQTDTTPSNAESTSDENTDTDE